MPIKTWSQGTIAQRIKEGPEGLLHFSEIPMSVDHSGRLENAPKCALPNGNTGTLPFGNASCFGSQKLVFMSQGLI